MAYVAQGGAKKGLKFALTLPGDIATTRTYTGLNVGTAGGNTAVTGPSYTNAFRFFEKAITELTNATLAQQFATTEQPYVWQE